MTRLTRGDLIRLYKTIHTWTGIVAGLALFIAFYAGALTMFKEPLARWASPPAAALTPLDRVDELITRTLAARPDARKDFTLHLGDGRGVPGRLSWQKSRQDESPWTAELTGGGELEIVQRSPSALAQIVDFLHRTAGIPGDLDIGTAFTGVMSALYLLALVSGVVVVVPSLVKDFFALRLGPNLKRLWLDAHNLVGIVSLPFHMVIALTSVVFGLHDTIYDSLDAVVYEGRLRQVMRASSPFNAVRPDERPAAMLPHQELIARVVAMEPGFRPVSLQYREGGTRGALVRVWGHDPRHLVRGKGFAVVSPVTGEVVNTEYLPGHQGPWSATVASFFSLHFGSFGGAPIRWSYFFLGLAGAFLFYSGNLLWIETRRRTQRREGGPVEQPHSVSLMAAATVGICLGCVCGLSLTIAAGQWLPGRVEDVNAWHRGLYYALFLGSVAWAVARGAARAGSDLLWLAAATTVAIPLTALLARTVPELALGPVMEGEFGVELVALCGALCFAALARAAGRRAANGPRDSIWSAAGPCPLPVEGK